MVIKMRYTSRSVGVTVMPAYVQSDGVEAVFDNLQTRANVAIRSPCANEGTDPGTEITMTGSAQLTHVQGVSA